MKRKIYSNKLLAVSMALVLGASVFMQGTLTAAAEEESSETETTQALYTEGDDSSGSLDVSGLNLTFKNGVVSFKVIADSTYHYYTLGVFKDGALESGTSGGDYSSYAGNSQMRDLIEEGKITEDGVYVVKVKISDKEDDWNFDNGNVAVSEEFVYSASSEKLKTPDGLKAQIEDTRLRLEWNEVENAEEYQVALYIDGNSDGIFYPGKNTALWLNRPVAGSSYTFRVRAMSGDATKFENSDWSAYSAALVWRGVESPDQEEDTADVKKEASDEQSSDSESDSESEQAQPWEPTTPEEIRRYECVGKEAVDYTPSGKNAYSLTFANAMQGPACFASFEAVLGDYTIGRTYDIYPAGNRTYSMEQEAEVTIKIPQAVYSPDRDYKMICVTKDGQPVILDDLDKNPDTVTFRTNKFYAFALIYK